MFDLAKQYDIKFPAVDLYESRVTITESLIDIVKTINSTLNIGHVVQFGFHAGHSAFVWLNTTDCKMLCFDRCVYSYAQQHANMMRLYYDRRFNFINYDRFGTIGLSNFDLAILDDAQSGKVFMDNLNACVEAGIQNILVYDHGLAHRYLDSIVMEHRIPYQFRIFWRCATTDLDHEQEEDNLCVVLLEKLSDSKTDSN